MKNEDAFNAYLSKEIGKLAPHTAKLKMAEKYHVGIPDFCLWQAGRSVVFECKFIAAAVITGGKILKHPFTGPQLTFLQTLLRARVPAFGVIGINGAGGMWLLPADVITAHGNWVTEEFGVTVKNLSWHPFHDVPGLVSTMFSYRVEGGVCVKS